MLGKKKKSKNKEEENRGGKGVRTRNNVVDVNKKKLNNVLNTIISFGAIALKKKCKWLKPII